MSYNNTTNTAQYIEPKVNRTHRGMSQTRWRWWYSSIADIMIRHPEIKVTDIALQLNKHPTTISMIVSTDMFKEYFHQRREAYRIDHDHALRARMTEVATQGLDIVLEQLKTKRTQIPLQAALKVVESSLDRLGYAPTSGPAVVVNNNQVDARQQTVSVSAADLEAARIAMRMAERSRTGSSLVLGLESTDLSPVPEACGVGQDVIDVEVETGDRHGPLP